MAKRNRDNYDDEQLKEAVKAVVEDNMSVRKASERYNVPKSTLQDRVSGKHSSKHGRPKELSDEEEELIKERIILLAEWGFPFTKQDLCYFIKSYLDKAGDTKRFVDNLPTRRFVERFLGRHKDLRLRYSVLDLYLSITVFEGQKKYFRQMFKIQNTIYTNPDNLVHREHSKVVFFIFNHLCL